MFGHLMRSELSRLRFRRRAWGSLVLMMLAGLLIPLSWMSQVRQPDARELVLAQVNLMRTQALGQCPNCTINDVTGTMDLARAIHDGIGPSGLVVAFLAFMIVVTYVGADFSSGALATQLTFTPRRRAVLTARVLACGLLGSLLMTVGLVTVAAVTVIGYMAVNGIGSLGTAPGLLGIVTGGAVYGFLLGIIAALVTFIIPSTPLAMASGVAVLVGDGVVEGWYFNSDPSWEVHRFMPIVNGYAMLMGNIGESGALASGGRAFLSRGEAILYHGVVIGVLFVLAVLLFERRDIKI